MHFVSDLGMAGKVKLLRRLLRLAKVAEQYRDADRTQSELEKGVRHAEARIP